ncbi:hypothetical protein CXG81DRAFT_10071 [Caulochytrium protostelioides]|uniref:Acetyl-CoA synthetase-like protein n=1 Tax=Caulochytrium protostelioides TaxID=1555241 RepID=A0A4P9XC64_9FUNG|nr:acetyl-CoA synthetase-like protein [Caulochytrium protostelioides]RKP03018.1 hypothetical protein CXG81DRAFT_10071 [Caulochytrium protostelioides]|eukprot:RKP03018.1 hypothetical protein CXG81DRAFT_10071 [Caulochytrium protostelioides]
MAVTNLAGLLADTASRALVLPASALQRHAITISYAQLRHLVAALAQRSPFRDLQPGDVVTYLVPDPLTHLLIFFAVMAKRAVANPLNPAYTADEIAFFVGDGKSRLLLVPRCDASPVSAAAAATRPKTSSPAEEQEWRMPYRQAVDDLQELAALLEGARATDPALFLHTSGTTGRPKGIMLAHANILATVHNITDTYHLRPSDITYLVMPLFHVHGLIGATLSTLASGGCVVAPLKFSVTAFWPDVLAHAATWYSAVPTIHQMLLARARTTYPGHSGALRFARSCSAPLSSTTFKALEQLLGVPVLEAYAMTEAAHQMTSNPPPPAQRKPGSVGVPMGTTIRILADGGRECAVNEVGEVCVHGENVISAYHNNPEATAKAFYQLPAPQAPLAPRRTADSVGPERYLRTGDMGYCDRQGYVFLTGRMKEQINRGGEKIAPLEIDEVMLAHPRVREAMAFGVPSAVYGEEIEAAIVLADSDDGGTSSAQDEAVMAQQMRKHCLAQLAGFKVPRRFHFVKALPKGPTGKVQRLQLAKALKIVPSDATPSPKAKL